MQSKPWYVSTEKWEANEPNTIPGATVLPHFEQRLARIVHTAETDAKAQQRLTLELIREVHTQKLLTWWVLIVIPTIITVLGVIITIKVHRPPHPRHPGTTTEPCGTDRDRGATSSDQVSPGAGRDLRDPRSAADVGPDRDRAVLLSRPEPGPVTDPEAAASP